MFVGCAFTGCIKSNSDVQVEQARAAVEDKIITTYIADNHLTGAKKVSDTSGVYYIVIQPGSGNALYTNSTQVTIGDTARLLYNDSTKTYPDKIFQQTDNIHPSFVLSQTILAWRLGIPKVNTGGIVRLLVPSRYAYGPFPQPLIGLPANAILDFNIQVYNVAN